jgi:cob(I)alamin adenosyltransferase
MPRIDAVMARIQNDLFDLGSDLATPGADPDGAAPSLRITPAQAGWIEQQIDYHNESLAPLSSFVLPGGTPLAAALHVARTVVRRAERLAVQLAGKEPAVNPATIVYLNRLSDLLFVLARVANANGRGDVLWAPGHYTSGAATPPPRA